jgi:predicted pyridoxine 5'-phosphate oxidase superfamily flavin-nucleotide-binding protein
MVEISPAQKRLIEGGVLALATATNEGSVNVVAVACCKVVGPNLILSTDNYFNKTRLNLLENPRVAVAVWSKDEKEGYQFKGVAQYITSGKWKEIVDKDPDNEGLAHKAAVLIEVKEIWDLVNPKLLARV